MRVGNSSIQLGTYPRGKFGFSGGLGRLMLGYNRLGFYDFLCGIYQKKYYFGKSYISKSKFYTPRNPQTELQQLWRSVVTAGWAEWATYDIEQKNFWRLRARKLQMTGANLFMSEWLKSHRSVLS